VPQSKFASLSIIVVNSFTVLLTTIVEYWTNILNKDKLPRAPPLMLADLVSPWFMLQNQKQNVLITLPLDLMSMMSKLNQLNIVVPTLMDQLLHPIFQLLPPLNSVKHVVHVIMPTPLSIITVKCLPQPQPLLTNVKSRDVKDITPIGRKLLIATVRLIHSKTLLLLILIQILADGVYLVIKWEQEMIKNVICTLRNI